jgi:amidase
MTVPDWQQKAETKRSQAAAKIPQEWKIPKSILGKGYSTFDIPRQSGILSDHEVDITENHDATDLIRKLASKEYSSLDVTTAFCKRAAIAQQLTSCLTETFFDSALRRAKELDDHLATTGKIVGPFHGLPISIKDSFSITGIPTTLGFVSFLENPLSVHNSALVEILVTAGAVLYVKTNIPQTMMTADSHNNVFGRVLNPYSEKVTAGGSSGGEGALVALRGSPLGVGTDIAGSIRIPALCCGLVGFKPTVGRVPYGGQTSPSRPGMTGIAPTAGPLCHSARDAELFLRVVFNSNAADLDDGALGIPWIEPARQSILTIGIMPEDPQRPIHPPMQRVLAEAERKLKAAGHKLVDLTAKMDFMSTACGVAWEYFSIDPDRTPIGHIARSGEPPIPSLRFTYKLDGTGPEPDLRKLFGLNVSRNEVTAQMRQTFVEGKLDIIIGPGYQSCAVAHDEYGVPMYTVLENLVDVSHCNPDKVNSDSSF